MRRRGTERREGEGEEGVRKQRKGGKEGVTIYTPIAQIQLTSINRLHQVLPHCTPLLILPPGLCYRTSIHLISNLPTPHTPIPYQTAHTYLVYTRA